VVAVVLQEREVLAVSPVWMELKEEPALLVLVDPKDCLVFPV